MSSSESSRAAENRELREYLRKRERQIQQRATDAPCELSFGQQRLWLLDQMGGGNLAYRIPFAMRISGGLDAAILERSIAAIVARHESLRTVFHSEQGNLQQIVREQVDLPLERLQLCVAADADPQSGVSACFREFAAQALDLQRGPLMRAGLLRLSGQEHVLMVVMHHIISDAWSMGVFVNELTTLYQAFNTGLPSPLPSLDIQYPDFAIWQRQRLRADALEQQLSYWRNKLSAVPTLELPGDRRRPPKQSFDGRVQRRVLSRERSDALRAFSRQRGVTLYMALLTGYAVMLYRYSGQSDLAIGSAITSRNRKELEGLIGFFVNMLVLRVDAAQNPSFKALLERVRKVVLEAFEHQEVPFEMLVRELEPDRDASRNPLAQVQFSMQSASGSGKTRIEGLQLSPVPEDVSTTRFDLECHVVEEAEGLVLQLIYNTALFDAATIERMLDAFLRVLEVMESSAELGIDDFDLLEGDSRRLVLEQWNATASAYPREASVVSLFVEQARMRPAAVALVFGEQQMSYAELDRRSNQLARHLQSLGVVPGTQVGLCAERSLQLVVAVLGILKAGAAYVPLDAEYPPERLRFMLRDTAARVLLSFGEIPAALREEVDQVVSLDASDCAAWRASDSALEMVIDATDLAYVMYTSGSTGEPKGVCVEHRAVLRLVRENNFLELGEDDVFLQLAPVSFDASTLELWGPLLNGGRLVMSPPGMLSLPALAGLLVSQRVSVLWLTAALFNRMVDAELDALCSVRQVLAGGEALSVAHVQRYVASLKPGARLVNGYGPTENTTFTCCHVMKAEALVGDSVPIGRPIANTRVYVLDASGRAAPVGVVGELHAAGDGLARGYLNQPALTQEKFIVSSLPECAQERLYRTGDLVRWRDDGVLEFVGRRDHQVKLRGYRIEPGEVETMLGRHPDVREAVVLCREDEPGDKRLVAYLVAAAGATVAVSALREHLRARLPEYMLPAAIVVLDELPLTAVGKLDRAALPAPQAQRQLEQTFVAPRNALEQRIERIWCEVLGLDSVGVDDNFFDLGGHSLLLTRVHALLEAEFDAEVPMVALFEFPNIAALAASLSGEADNAVAEPVAANPLQTEDTAIAIIATTGRFPGAANVETLWEHIAGGVEAIRFFSAEELVAAGVPRTLIDDPGYVPARGSLDDVEWFDAAYFGYTPREAEFMDPQHRLFLECAAEAIERGGYDPERYPGAIGVWAGCGSSGYVYRLRSRPDLVADAGGVGMLVGNDKDFLTTRVSYKLNLRGPSVTVQTACSTSLVAVHEACRSLRDGECDMALAGGVSVNLPRVCGYTHVEHSILSRDGHCRAFDADASGTVTGEGVAVVLLKRLADALRDGDPVQGVVLGTAINNDGSDKVGYTAPSVRAQSRVVAAAQARAGVAPATIGYLEAHGTGTALGDPIEVAALNRVFAADAEGPARCAMGSIKSNIGHLDAAAGAAGLIKATLALKHRALPPSVNFTRPNPAVDFDAGPFYINTELREWPRSGEMPRRAAVSSFGIGGTNAHAVLEEAPVPALSGASREVQMLPVSAVTEQALDEYCGRLADHLEQHPEAVLADVSYTFRRGRRELPSRRAIICRNAVEAVAALRARPAARRVSDGDPAVVFLFPGQGAQYPDMGRALYDREPRFRETVDACCEMLEPLLDIDLRTLLYRADGSEDPAQALSRTRWTQPALFVTEYALARLWMSWGIQPTALLGHSVGEIVAACVAGVLTLEAALQLVAQRGRCMDEAPRGAMLAVPMAAAALGERLEAGSWVAAINAPGMSVASGSEDALEALQAALAADGIETRRLHTSHAFHCPLLEDAAAALDLVTAQISHQPASIPYLSNVTGEWVSADELEPGYWARQMLAPVQFSKCLERLIDDLSDTVLLEVGPGQTLAGLARLQPGAGELRCIASSLPNAAEQDDASAAMHAALADLWCSGASIDWDAFDAGQDRQRLLLPTYPYQRQRYWIDSAPVAAAAPRSLRKLADVGEWAYLPSWQRSAPLPRSRDEAGQRWLVIGDTRSTESLVSVLAQSGIEVSVASADELDDLPLPEVVLLAANLHRYDNDQAIETQGDTLALEQLPKIARWLANARTAVKLLLVQRAVHDVLHGDPVRPAAAALLSACRVLAQESGSVQWRAIDLSSVAGDPGDEAEILRREIAANTGDEVVAYRGGRRWIQSFVSMPLATTTTAEMRIRQAGTYLVTGGLGRIGAAICAHLGALAAANVVVTTRRLEADGELAPSKLAAVRQIEAAGAQVLLLEADLTDATALQRAVQIAGERFGRIDGVIHAAGITAGDGFGSVAELDARAWRDHLDVNLQAARHLETVFQDLEPDFMLAMGSLSSLLGGLGLAAYAAGNAALAAYVSAPGEAGSCRWCCIDWDGWRFSDSEGDGAVARLAMTPQEGLEVMQRVLSLDDVNRVIISTASLELRQHQASALVDETQDEAGERHHRPEMAGYLAPRNDTERRLAEIWGRLLGVDPVGVEDNFLDLGGHSLLATQIISRVQQQFDVKVALAELISGATIAHLAGIIDNARWAQEAIAADTRQVQEQREEGEL